MADVNWTKYNCDICRIIGFVAAAVVAALVIWLLAWIGPPVWLLVILFLLVWAGLFFLVEGYCVGRVAATVVQSTPVHVAAEDTAAQAEAERVAAERAAAEQAAAEQAAAERAAAERARAERAAAEKAESERAAAERAAGERAAAEPIAVGDKADRDGDGVVEGTEERTRPAALSEPRGGVADDLKRIKGIGAKLEKLCNDLGFYHFDQIAAWTADEVAWVDANLTGFKGRVTRDNWVAQAKTLAEGGETDFSKRVDDGDVPSSQ